mmetsp:Transcript_21839/g.28245  ORF Transcript_21839/g.28245 Transcript_21839/m.28245 type:complete len:387 (-) Transcript_21839:41-1201(-)|eukprot:CAMPEP_0198151232 /NCGR_PEP_ID=MMETSP1443-20131203/54816_1 /TAXON_ID=186043 /ORGANISM="Entomoneis sp., Strain CCMP2396" /LENGTH=386 /DNA_ID=CAMNT_0043816835 /DNA_START=86 /DNA_END=1246 /DNA_ORIENTATION=+
MASATKWQFLSGFFLFCIVAIIRSVLYSARLTEIAYGYKPPNDWSFLIGNNVPLISINKSVNSTTQRDPKVSASFVANDINDTKVSSAGESVQGKTGSVSSISSISSPRSKTMILTFVTIGFVKHVDFWYQRLSDLGYTEHVVAAWDNETLEHCKTLNLRVVPCVSSGFKGKVPKGKNQLFRRYLFAARWKCVLQQLQAGYNILLTDVDNSFQRYVPLSNFENFNVIHAYGGGYPIRHLKAHGFTVCGGMTWLQAKPPTLKYVQLIVDQCGDRCDDQGRINNLFVDLKVNWTIQPLQQQLPPNHNWPEPAGSRLGIAKLTGHSVMIWDTRFAFRGPLETSPCPDNPWVAMPFNNRAEKTHYQWEDKCPSPRNQTLMNKRRRKLDST